MDELASDGRIDGYAPIRDYALIGNKRAAALVARDGAIDWFAPGGFDAPTIFAALLDARRGGMTALRPAVPFTVQRAYRHEANVLETTFVTAEGRVTVTDAMSLPAARTLSFSEIVRAVDGVAGSVPMRWTVAPRFSYGERRGELVWHGEIPCFVDGHDVVAVQVHGAGAPRAVGGDLEGTFTCREGDHATLAISCFPPGGPLAFASEDELRRRVEATTEHWRRWCADTIYDGPWREAVVRSALMLDLLIDEDTSAVLAAPTMGLPERIGGDRNYDYRYAWVRDGNLTLEAMLRLGFSEQVHASLAWILDATETTHPWLRPMYRRDGRSHLPEKQPPLEGYRGSQPVVIGNSAETQLQLSSYGDVFDMLWRYVDSGNALGPHAQRRVVELADFVCRIWERPDSGLWELSDEQQYTQTKLACWLALNRAVQLADSGAIGQEETGRWRAERERIARFLHERCWSAERNAYLRAAGNDGLDASVLLASRASVPFTEPERLSGTLDAIFAELGAGGPLLYRYSGMQDKEGAFLACSFWAVEAAARCGRLEQAHDLMDQLIALGNDVGLYSEEIDPATGAFLGNMPQALTHLALVNAADVVWRSGQPDEAPGPADAMAGRAPAGSRSA